MALSREDGAPLFAGAMVGTLRLIAYLALAIGLMVCDHHYNWMYRLHQAGALLLEPLYRLAGLPSEGMRMAATAFADRQLLTEQNQRLRQDLLLANAKLNRLAVVAQQNRRLQQLLETQHSLGIRVQLARVIGVDLGLYQYRITINLGARDGVEPGQPVIDSHGVMGQVVSVLPTTSRVMLLTDPDHALPVTDERSGARTVAYGSREEDRLVLPHIALTQDIKVGDRLLTSGLGGRFPAGFPVGEVKSLEPGGDGGFLEAVARPAADLERSDEVLLLHDLAGPAGPPPLAPRVGPPASLAPPRQPTGMAAPARPATAPGVASSAP